MHCSTWKHDLFAGSQNAISKKKLVSDNKKFKIAFLYLSWNCYFQILCFEFWVTFAAHFKLQIPFLLPLVPKAHRVLAVQPFGNRVYETFIQMYTNVATQALGFYCKIHFLLQVHVPLSNFYIISSCWRCRQCTQESPYYILRGLVRNANISARLPIAFL